MASFLAPYRDFSRGARAFLTGSLILEIAHAFIWTLQNLYIRSLGHGETVAGTILTASALGVVVFTFPSAWLYERIGARSSLTLSCLAKGLSMFGLILSESTGALTACAFFGGGAITLHRVISAPYLITLSKKKERTYLFHAEFGTHALAQAIGPLASGILAAFLYQRLSIEADALRGTLLLGGIVAILAAIPFRFLSSVKPKISTRTGSVFQIFKPRNMHLWVRLTVVHLIIGYGAGLTIPFMNLFFTDRMGFSTDALGAVMAASSFAMVIATFLTPRLVHRLGMLKATVLTQALSLPFFFILAFTTSPLVAVGAFIFRTGLMNLAGPIWRQLLMEVTPVDWRAPVNSVSELGWSLGWAFSNQTGGWLIEHAADVLGGRSDGYTLPMLITIAVYIIAILLEAALFWKVRDLGKLGLGSSTAHKPTVEQL